MIINVIHENQRLLCELAKEIADLFSNAKVILTMRGYTLGDIKTDYGGTLNKQPILHLTPPDIMEVVSTRLRFISRQLQSVTVPMYFGNQGQTGKLILHDVKSFFNEVLKAKG